VIGNASGVPIVTMVLLHFIWCDLHHKLCVSFKGIPPLLSDCLIAQDLVHLGVSENLLPLGAGARGITEGLVAA
jgi:hypothetical protein